MRKKNGFISMTLVYTFLILFMFLMLAILRTYTEKDKFLQAINDQIDNDIGVAKGSRVTLINRLLEDNMPSSDGNINYARISNDYYGNGNGFYYMEKKSLPGYKLESITDENADGHTSRIYFFRGNVENNHIVFANMCFRIIRTNEDGSVRIVYNGPNVGSTTSPKCKTLNNTSFASLSIGNAKFNTTDSVEYVKIVNGSVPEADESNVQSPITNILNEWYRDNFTTFGSNTVNYSEYIAKGTIFCNNKTKYQSTHYYKSKELAPLFSKTSIIYDDANVSNLISFRCENTNDRFTISEKNIFYPIGILTAQDVVLAGGYLYLGDEDNYHGGPNGVIENSNFYLFSENSYWTMSPLSDDGKVIYFRNDGSYHGILEGAPASSSYAVRPVISLNQNVVVSSGNGTANTPYIVRTDAS